MRSITVSLFFLLACHTIIHAQYRELVGKPYSQQLDVIDRLYRQVVDERMPAAQLADTLAGMRRLDDRLDNHELRLEADLLEADFELNVGSGKPDRLLHTLEEAEKAGVFHIACRAAWRIGQHYWAAEQYEQGFRWYLRLDRMMEEIDVTDFPDKANYLEEIGRAHYRFGDYEKALPYFEKVVNLPIRDFYRNRWRHAVNTMGLTYRELGQLDQSDTCFQRLIKQEAGISEQWVGIASGNLGYNYYLRGDYDAAIPLCEKDILIAEKYNDMGLAAGSAILLADILTQRGRLAEARVHIDKAYDYIQRSRQTDRLRLLYPVMSKWHTTAGQHGKAAVYLDSALAANKRFSEKFNALKLMRANQEINFGQQRAALRQLQANAARQRLVRNTIIGGLLVALIAVLAIYRSMVGQSRTRHRLQELELERTRGELENSRLLLEGYTRKISNNSRLIQSIADSTEFEHNDGILQQLRNSTILTDSDWQDFRKLFQKVYPGIMDRLVARHPNLTTAEVRYLLLLRLELSNPEIANALGISPASLRVTWHRLRKKIGLSAAHQPKEIFTDHLVGL
ncbi:MAG TPA: tetratricopeptide repeat protein [Parapedobacter sp.]|uniref:tetratricopeptide repeat protein n=1 Tax=Parapedobacter sp. TaxID=1958893 RepID=UPI002C214076|nr:tetratricopeptide repeat protein [Parapedobacter sp.]HWK59496.1 tetratricopeptide repeat protein [Parapedobacter sp.]